jgi:cobalt-zinc-cadmium efflux system outer membrane protein
MSRSRLLSILGLLLLSGCRCYTVEPNVDQAIRDLAKHPFDPDPLPVKEPRSAAPPRTVPNAPPADGSTNPGPEADSENPSIEPTSALTQADKDLSPEDVAAIKSRLSIPPVIPGSQAPVIVWPREKEEKQREILRLYPDLPELPGDPPALPGPDGQPYTLAALQQLAAAHNPQLKQAAALVEQAKANVIQAGVYPNPTVGYESDTAGTGATAGFQGFFIDQFIKTAGKLKLQQAQAVMDLLNAELALKRARSDLATQVRSGYFSVLVARESVKVNRGLAQFAYEVYRVQLELLKGGLGAAYEPAQLRALVYTARSSLIQSLTSYQAAWNQLASTLGARHLPLSEVAGRIDWKIPCYDYEAAKALVLRNHTDVLTARNTIEKSRYGLQLARVSVYPDIETKVTVQKDYTAPPFQIVHSVQIGGPLPIWDQNKGNILAAQAQLVHDLEEPHRVEVVLTGSLANAFANYKNNLQQLQDYREHILPDLVTAYRGVFDRRNFDPSVTFGDLVNAQQTLAAGVTTYLTTLGQLWQSVVSVADLLQTDDLFQVGQEMELPHLPDLEHLPELPCKHPCK